MNTLRIFSGCLILTVASQLVAAEAVHEHEEGEHVDHVEFSRQEADAMGVRLAPVGSQSLHQTLVLYGKISPDPNQISHLTARYPGLIQSVEPDLGDTVEAGELVATIQANDSLQTYELRAPISGVVVDMHANPGEFAGTEPLLTLANYEDVWADLNIFPGQASRIQAGQAVRVTVGELSANSRIRYLNPGQGLTPYVVARVPIANADAVWTPGLLVEAEVSIGEFDVNLAVANEALQEVEGNQVVFVREQNRYEVRPLQLGRSDGRFTEVLGGLNVGEEYVVANSYLLKADLEKSGAAHHH